VRDAVIVDAVRAPIGRRKGTLKGVHPVDLSASVLTALAGRNQLDPELIEDIVWGCVTQIADQSTNVGRLAVQAASKLLEREVDARAHADLIDKLAAQI